MREPTEDEIRRTEATKHALAEALKARKASPQDLTSPRASAFPDCLKQSSPEIVPEEEETQS
ncbi:MAG: hypothetical protein LDL41_07505 [Coleofasciculus sp. S288]|nr:hypothetical protein [Coleofasciculus sp. S288]